MKNQIQLFMLSLMRNLNMENDLTANELLKLISRQWATTKQIMRIGNIGEGKALRIKNRIKKEIDEPETLPRDKVPMVEVVKFFNINIEYLKKVAIGEDENGK